MSRLFLATLIFILMATISEGTIVSAQGSSTLVQFGSLPGVESIDGAPGSTVNVPVSIMGTAGVMPRVDADISVPAPLRVLDTSYCSAETARATQEPVFGFQPCQIVGQIRSDESQLISAEIDGLGSLEVFRINATLVVEIPSNATVGSEHTIRTLNYDFFREPSRITIVVTESSTHSVPPAISSTRDISPAGPLYDIDGSTLEFPVGSIRPYSFEINYDAYPEATSASLTLYASTGIIDVADPSVVIDWDASYTCDSSGAATSRSLNKPKHSIAVLPAFFNLSLPRWMEPGTEVHVCAVVVYYNGNNMLGVERYMSVITVRE